VTAPLRLRVCRVFFDDLHDSGIFSYEYLDHLGRHKLTVGREYLRALECAASPGTPAGAPERKGRLTIPGC